MATSLTNASNNTVLSHKLKKPRILVVLKGVAKNPELSNFHVYNISASSNKIIKYFKFTLAGRPVRLANQLDRKCFTTFFMVT